MQHIFIWHKAATQILLLMSWILTSCSEQEGAGSLTPDLPETRLATVFITIGAAESHSPISTKAESVSVGEDTEFERHIKHWWVVVVNSEDKVEQVLHDKPASTNPLPDSQSSTSLELPVGGHYTAYAFANLPTSSHGDNDGARYIQLLRPGEVFQKDKLAFLTSMNDYHPDGEQYIPMSSYGENFTVSDNEIANRISIRLIRLVGKISVSILNASGSNVEVESLTLEKFRQGPIYLLPYDAAKGEITQNLLNEYMDETYKPLFPENEQENVSFITYPLVTNDMPLTLTASGESAQCAYTIFVPETDFTAIPPIEGSGELNIKVVSDNRSEEPKSTQFSFIRRNDWLKIPLLISEADVRIKLFQQHMPIGGIPEEVTFTPGMIIPQQVINLTHAGKLTLTYEIVSLNQSTDWTLQYYEGNYEAGQSFCCATIQTNEDGLLIEEEDLVELPWRSNTNKGYLLTTDGPLKGHFTINTQELALGKAILKLFLVAKNNTTAGTIVELPYELELRMGNATTQDIISE